MNRTYTIILFALLGSCLLLNCDCKHVCTPITPVVRFVNFDSSALNTVVVKQYTNNGRFADLQMTTVYTSKVFTGGADSPGPDTMHLDSNGIFLDFFTDVIIEVPSASRSWAIRGVSAQPAKMAESTCVNGVNYYLNDTLHRVASSAMESTSAHYIYLSR